MHFLHVRSPEPNALPLILTHGWPGSVAEFLDIIGPLTDPRAYGGQASDAFHVIAPSIPGFAFSGPTTTTGWGVSRIAAAWAQLMNRLGYRRYGAQGGDFGSVISPELGRLDTAHVAGVHVNALTGTPPAGAAEDVEGLTEGERARLQNLKRWYTERPGYATIQSTRPRPSPTRSPIRRGQLAWNAEWFEDYGLHVGTIDRDRILTNVMLYWLTDTAGSAARLYREAAGAWGQQPERSSAPTGVAVFPGDSTIRRFAERDHTIVHWSEFDRGGHFAAMQAPDLLVQDIREFFRQVR